MSTINEVLEIRNKYDALKKQEEELWHEMKEVFNVIDIEEYQKLNYDECKNVFEKVLYRIDDEVKNKLSEILKKKKAEVYPEILKAHYYPELNTLSLSDKDTVEIDNFIRHHLRHIFTENLINECKPLTENIDGIVSLGILEKKYSLKCCECGDSSETLSQDELDRHKRIWEIEAIVKDTGWTDELDAEFYCLYEECSHGCIEIYCMDCDDMHKEITNLNEFEEYLSDGNIEVYYRINKNPNLTYEKL